MARPNKNVKEYMNFNWLFGKNSTSELPEIYPFPLAQGNFVENDMTFMYSRILTDVLERTQGIPDDKMNIFFDSCLASESSDGLITMLAKAMYHKTKLFLVYSPALNVIVKATSEQQRQIEADYKKTGQSSVGVFISFQEFKKSDMIKVYSVLSYFAINGFYKSMNLSTALIMQFSKMRESTAANDSKQLQDQALAMVEALGKGKSIAMDALDKVIFPAPDLTATDKAVEFIDNKLSFYLGLPSSYIKGLNAKGLSDTGQSETKAVERGLRNYYFSIVKPIVEQLFRIKTTFKTDDFDQIQSSLEVLKTFELTSDEFLNADNKLLIINKMFGLPSNTKGGSSRPQNGAV